MADSFPVLTAARFRLGLLAYLVLLAAGVAAAILRPDVPEELAQTYDALPPSLLFGSYPLTLIVLLLALTASAAGWIGLYRLQAWGRTLSLWSTSALLVLLPWLGASVTGGLESALWEASSLLWGALLACAYFSPVAREFKVAGGDTHGVPA